MGIGRLQEFKEKFDQELRKENIVHLHDNPNGIDIAIREHMKQTADNTTPNVSPETPSTSSVSSQSVVVEPVQSTSSQGPAEKDLLKAYKSANDVMQKFYNSVLHDDKIVNEWGDNLESGRRTEAISILKEASRGDTNVSDKLIELFNAQNEYQYKHIKLQVEERGHFKRIIDNLVQKRVGEQAVNAWSLASYYNSAEELEEKLQLVDDPLELEMIKTFEGPYDTKYYREAKKLEIVDLYKTMVFLKGYDGKMRNEVAATGERSFCVDSEEVDTASKRIIGSLKATPPVAGFKKKLGGILKRINELYKNQVQSREQLCIEKAVQHACFRYCEILKGNQSAGVDINAVHSVVYQKIVSKFESLENFKYSKNWKWPVVQPMEISKCLREEAQEAEKRRKEVIDAATTMLKNMKSDEQLKYLKEHFPQYVKEPAGGSKTKPSGASSVGSHGEPPAKKAKGACQDPPATAASTSTPSSVTNSGSAVPNPSPPSTGFVAKASTLQTAVSKTTAIATTASALKPTSVTTKPSSLPLKTASFDENLQLYVSLQMMRLLGGGGPAGASSVGPQAKKARGTCQPNQTVTTTTVSALKPTSTKAKPSSSAPKLVPAATATTTAAKPPDSTSKTQPNVPATSSAAKSSGTPSPPGNLKRNNP